MPLMLRWLFREDQYVIQIYHIRYIYQPGQGPIDVRLKGGRGIGQTKWHDKVLKVTVASAKRCLPYITALDTDAMIRILQIQL